MFHKFGELEPSDTEISLWSDRIVHILENGGGIRLVQIYSVARKPSKEIVLPLEKKQLERIGTHLESKIPYHATTKIEVYA